MQRVSQKTPPLLKDVLNTKTFNNHLSHRACVTHLLPGILRHYNNGDSRFITACTCVTHYPMRKPTLFVTGVQY